MTQICECLLNNIGEGVVMVRRQDNQFVLVNAQFEHMLGFAPGELKGTGIELIQPANAEAQQQEQAMIAALETNSRWAGERQHLGKRGQCVRSQANVTSFEHPEFGEVYLSIERHIPQVNLASEWLDEQEVQLCVEMEVELARQRDALALESGLSTLSNLAAGLTHELTQPLTAITYYCETFQALEEKSLEQQAMAGSLVERIRSQTGRAMDVVSELRDFTRRMNPELTILSVESLLRDALELVKILACGRKVRLHLSKAEDLPQVNGDVIQLKQVLLHLLRNAIETAGSITDRDRVVTVEANCDPQWVSIRVKDNGHGMDESLPWNIFDIMKTGTPKFLGLGLGTSQSIVRAHGGRLWQETTSAQGGYFQFTLPVAGKSHAH